MRRSFTYVVFPLLVAVVSVVVMETVVRTYFAFSVGPRVLLYGLVDDDGIRVLEGERPAERYERAASVGPAENPLSAADVFEAGYAKYTPNESRVDVDPETGEAFAVKINASGFRGDDFARVKSPGTVRILALGASATVGAHSRDDQTWPSSLEAILSERCGSRDYEVINLGIASLDSAGVLALFREEGIDLAPDLVLFYGGGTDSRRIRPEPTTEVRWVDRLRDYSMLVAFMDNMSDWRGRQFDPNVFGPRARAIASEFIGNLSRVEKTARRNGIGFIAITQQAQSSTVESAEMEGLSFASEHARIQQGIVDGRRVFQPSELDFLAHVQLVEALRLWTSRARITLVDGIEALDADRHELLGLVDLTPRGNRLLAEAVAGPVLEETCPVGAQAALADPAAR